MLLFFMFFAILINPLFFRHVISSKILEAEVKEGSVKTLDGVEIMLKKKDPVEIEFGGKTAKVVTADINAKNGVIHEIDPVIGF
jgi:uncharacterized surface protein with fasciclin (FAS1) repeats